MKRLTALLAGAMALLLWAGCEQSAQVLPKITERAAAPRANPPAGKVAPETAVLFSTATEGAEIYYTLDGSEPDSAKTRYAGAIYIDAAMTIKAVAVKEGMEDSAVLEAAYTLAEPGTGEKPSESPGTGTEGEETPEPEDPETPVAVRLEIAALPDITFYARGQDFESAGLRVNEVYSDESVKELNTYTLDPVNMTRPGQKMVYVRSGALSAYFSVYVDSSDAVLRDVVFTKGPNKTVYEFGENFSKTGAIFTAIYSDGSEKELDSSACSYIGHDRTKRGTQQVFLKVNKISYAVEVRVKIPANAVVAPNEGSSYISDSDYRHVWIKSMPLEFDKLNLNVWVKANGETATLKGGEDFTLGEINLRGYDAYKTGWQTISFDLDERKGISFSVYVADVEPAVWFDYGYQRTPSDTKGAGQGAGKYYAQPGETLVLTPVRYLIGYNDDNSPGYVSYSWSVSGGAYTGAPSSSGEIYAFTPAAAGTYTVTAQVTGRNFVTGSTTTMGAVTEVVCYTGTVNAGPAFVSPLKNFAPGQFTSKGTGGLGWSLGAWGGYEVWAVDPQDSYQIRGNPFFGWSEPGIVWLQEDRNGNGIPDEMWYELVGEQEGLLVTRRYAVTYMAAGNDGPAQKNAWVDSKGRGGIMHGGHPAGAWVTFTGTLLNDRGTIAKDAVGPGGWGYVDSWSSNKDWDYFYLSNAIRADGSPADLSAVRFIKVHTGLFIYGGPFGENSTEINFADGLPDQSGGFPDPQEYD